MAGTRLGADGEPELLLFDDGGGYGWNVPKSDWVNVGCGTLDANRVRAAWRTTHDYLRAAGHLPDSFEVAWPTLRPRYGEPFYRTWKYYLLASAGAFRARTQHLF